MLITEMVSCGLCLSKVTQIILIYAQGGKNNSYSLFCLASFINDSVEWNGL